MGQAQSVAAVSPGDDVTRNRSSTASSISDSSSASPSMESLIAEAAAYGNEADESLDAKANRALECPCIADLRKGPCGVQFSDAFLCFFKSTAEEKTCIKANPNAFSKDILDVEEGSEENEEKEIEKEEERTHDYRVIPPVWSREPRSPKSKL